MNKLLLIALFYFLFLRVNGQNDSIAPPTTRTLNEKNYVSLEYEFAHFNSDLNPWNTATLEAQFNHKQWVFVPRATTTSRFDQTGWSVEQDAYRKLKSKDYFYLHAGYSPSTVFYNYRLAGEYYNAFAKSWEHSIGARYIYYHDNTYAILGTASLSKYYSRFLTILRGNIGYQNNADLNVLNGTLQQRYYHSDNSYSALQLGYGFDPNLVLFNNSEYVVLEKNTQFNASLRTVQELGKNWVIQGQVACQWYDFGILERWQYIYALKIIYCW